MQGWYDLSSGARVAGYEIVRPLGRGGSGAVYEAQRDGVAVALKILHEVTAAARFEREVALVARLDHPHVVRLLDHGRTENGQPFIAFELVRGRALHALLRPGRGFEPPRVAAIGTQILAAVAAAHALGIVHRDIKPANVMLSSDDRVRVLDFGLAKAIFGDPSEVETITETGHRLGTPRYMSPEMARGLKAGPEGDVYSVALVVAEMITGAPVIASNIQVDVLMHHASDEPIALETAVRRSPFGPLIARALAKDPASRPTAAAMRDGLAEALAMHERALVTFGMSAPATSAPWDDQEATVLMAPADPLATTLSMEAEVPRRSSRTWLYVSGLVLAVVAIVAVFW